MQYAPTLRRFLALFSVSLKLMPRAQRSLSLITLCEIEPSPLGYLLLAQALEIGGHAAALAAHSQAARMTPDLNPEIAVVKQILTI